MSDLPDASTFRRGDGKLTDASRDARYRRERERIFTQVQDAFRAGHTVTREFSPDVDLRDDLVREIVAKGYYVEWNKIYDARYRDGIRGYRGFTVHLNEPRAQAIERERAEEAQRQSLAKLRNLEAQERAEEHRVRTELSRRYRLPYHYTAEQLTNAQGNEALKGCLFASPIKYFTWWIILCMVLGAGGLVYEWLTGKTFFY